MSDARIVSDATAELLLEAVSEGSLGAGAAADLARRISDKALAGGVDLDELLELANLGSRR